MLYIQLVWLLVTGHQQLSGSQNEASRSWLTTLVKSFPEANAGLHDQKGKVNISLTNNGM